MNWGGIRINRRIHIRLKLCKLDAQVPPQFIDLIDIPMAIGLETHSRCSRVCVTIWAELYK